jgi:lipopolysaccharide transport system permease protein
MVVELQEPILKDADSNVSSQRRSLSTLAEMRNLWSLRQLIGIMIHRDLLSRYKGSVMGAFWPVINPLGHLLLYTFVFNVILKVRFGSDGSTSNFAIYLMTGLVAWGAFSEAIARSPGTILEVPNLVKKVVFPLQILPLVLALSSLLSQSIALLLLLATAAIFFKTVHWTIVFLPLIVFSQILLTTGLSWLLASLGVFVRDLQHVISLGLSAWMYSTPIVYPASALPANLKFILYINPLAGIVTDYRRVILQGQSPDWLTYAAYTAVGVGMWFAGFYFFHKTKKSFADVM